MTKQEFLYDHDYDSIIDLINREIQFKNGESSSAENIVSNEPVRATDFL